MLSHSLDRLLVKVRQRTRKKIGSQLNNFLCLSLTFDLSVMIMAAD